METTQATPTTDGEFDPNEVEGRGIQQLLNSGSPVSNYNTNTYGSVTFRRLEENKRTEQSKIETLVADSELQSRLESLCETLRSRY